MNADNWRDELQVLCEAVLEERLSPEQLARLEQLVLGNPDARRFYVEYLHQHGALHWAAGEPELLERGVRLAACSLAEPSRERTAQPAPAGSARLAFHVVAAAALVAVGGWLLLGPGGQRPPELATLVNGKGCKWDAGSLPTEVGARLGTGRMRLAEGIVRIVFDNGAEVTLEAPADLELLSTKKCVLHGGRLVAKVPPRATGFTVDTPTALLKDLGTEFGVNVRDAQTADVQVFNGTVDVQHRPTGKTERLLTGRNRRFGQADARDFDPNTERPAVLPENRPLERGQQIVQISTATGRGKDAYVQPIVPSHHRSDILLLIKNTAQEKSEWNRKAYLGMDLSSVAGLKIIDAQLSLTFAPTGLGFASEVPDATFIVYGLTDETLDDWDEKTLRWQNAPANLVGGAKLDLEKVVRLGSFAIAQGALQGTRSIAGAALIDFLNRNSNGLATFIVVRETKGSGRADLVHGFANKQHPTLPPPTLKLTVVPK